LITKLVLLKLLTEYFPDLSPIQLNQFEVLEALYYYWNSKINLISRKDISFFYEKHVLHSLSIAKVIRFKPLSEVLDVGTGGGFPGIPLAILFPNTKFYLIDSIGRKLKVVNKISNSLKLKNIEIKNINAKNFNRKVDFVISRAVTSMDKFVPLIINNFKIKNKHKLKNGILCLKGGDLNEELINFPKSKE
jgi:16S rRNA (guanine527-N7)-methyltransferase